MKGDPSDPSGHLPLQGRQKEEAHFCPSVYLAPLEGELASSKGARLTARERQRTAAGRLPEGRVFLERERRPLPLVEAKNAISELL